MSQPVARLHSLRSVQLRVPTVAESTDFYSEVWGLSVVERERDETWLRGTGANHHVLQLSHGDRNGLGRISFAVRTRREVDEAARRLAAHGVPVLVEPRNLDQVGGGYGVQFADPEGRLVELVADVHVADVLIAQHGDEIHALAPSDVRLEPQTTIDPLRRLFRVEWTAGPQTCLERGEPFGAVLRQHRRVDAAGRDAVDRDAARRELLRHRLGEALQAAL